MGYDHESPAGVERRIYYLIRNGLHAHCWTRWPRRKSSARAQGNEIDGLRTGRCTRVAPSSVRAGRIVMAAIEVTLCALLGVVVGSFLNVVIYRVPRHLSVVTPRSSCPNCAAPISGRDNVPLVSWLVLRGHCRHCHCPIPFRYPLVEIVSAGLFAGAALRLGFHWDLPAFLVLLSSLVALAWIDYDYLILPTVIIYPTFAAVGALLTAAALLEHDWHRLLVAGLCAAGWFLIFFLINALNPRWLGFGDVRLAPVLGLGLGWLGVRVVILGFFSANVVGALIGITLIATKKIERSQPIPYGVFLALGTVAAVFAGPMLLALFAHLA